MSVKSNMNDIETSKENILPIRQGRRADVMFAVLSKKDDHIQDEKRSYFENELRSYVGDDPLKIWLEYISWVEQNFITGGKDFSVVELVKKCLFALKDKEIYRNDPRILPIWLKFANASSDPLEVFNYMASNGICCMLARFYVEWAWKLEAVGNLKAANAALQDGINIGAKPREAIQHAICQLDVKSVKAIRETFSAAPTQAQQRQAFSKLKPQGKKHAAPVLRVGDVVQEAGPLRSNIENAQPQPQLKPSRPFKVFQGDESARVHALPKKTQVSSKSMSSHIFHPEVNKENVRKPGKWTEVKASKWIPPRHAAARDAEFTIHCDDDDQEPEAHIPKKPVIAGVLSAKKDTTNNPPVALFEEPDPYKKVMYDKVKVYCGGTEYSFEEIHAAILYHEQGERKNSEEQFLRVQKPPQELEKSCTISKECDGEKKRIEHVLKGADVAAEKSCFSPKLCERSTHSSLYHSSCENIVGELLATGSHGLSDEKFPHSQSSTPDDGMAAEIHYMMQSLCAGPVMAENCHISNYAGITESERVLSVSYREPEPVHDSVSVEAQQNLGSQQPFQIYCDVTEEVPPLHLKSNVHIQPDPDDQKVHDIENIIYINSGITERAQSVSCLEPEPVCDNASAGAQQNLGSQQPFQIYCDATEEVPPLYLKSNVHILPDPDNQKAHDVENIPPPTYCIKDKIHDDLIQPSGSDAVVGSQRSFYSLPEQERADHELDEQNSFVENYTIVPPQDTAHFMLDVFVASTPCSKVQSSS